MKTIITVTESCRHNFTLEEKGQLADLLAERMNDKDAAKGDFDSVKAAYNARVTRIDADLDEYAAQIRQKFKMVDVQCLILKFRPDVDHKMIVRTDNGLVLRLEKLKADEKQLKLTTKEPESWSWEADFYSEENDGVSRMVAANVGLSNEEYKALKDAGVRANSKRKALGAATTEK